MNKLKNIIKVILGERNKALVISILNFIRKKYQNALRPIKKFLPIKASFIVVGAQKSGTSALYHFLSQHPELSLSILKETNFFSTEKYWISGEDYNFYKEFFRVHFKKIIYGEASPSYMLNHDIVAPRIAKYNPDMKLIFILKNPIDRAFSQYKMHRKKYNLNLSFRQCLNIAMNPHEEIILDKSNPVTLNGSKKTIESYIKFGHYVKQIRSFQKHFGTNQILILLTEDLLNDHENTMRKIFNFLDISPIIIKSEIIHSNEGVSEIDTIERAILLREYSKDIDHLEKLLHRDLSHWKN